MYLKGNELYDDIRKIQSKKTFQLISKFLNSFPNFKRKKQIGKSNFFKKKISKGFKIEYP